MAANRLCLQFLSLVHSRCELRVTRLLELELSQIRDDATAPRGNVEYIVASCLILSGLILSCLTKAGSSLAPVDELPHMFRGIYPFQGRDPGKF